VLVGRERSGSPLPKSEQSEGAFRTFVILSEAKDLCTSGLNDSRRNESVKRRKLSTAIMTLQEE